MLTLGKCSFYRDSENLGIGRGLGLCDLRGQALCEGDVKFCECPEDLKRQLSEQRKQGLADAEAENRKKGLCRFRVLIVDDDESVRKVVATYLATQGHQVAAASDGMKALNGIHRNRYDAVITDIVMPGLDGISLIKEVLSLYPKLPIMVMTGYGKDYSTEDALKAGALEFIGKPFGYDEFVLRFNKMMEDHEMLCRMEVSQSESALRAQTG